MKKVILFSLMLAGNTLNADFVQPKLPDSLKQEKIQQLLKLVEKNQLTQSELALLLKAEEDAEVIGLATVACTVIATALIYTVLKLGKQEIENFNNFCEENLRKSRNS